MTHAGRLPAKTCLVLGIAAGLAACGGGGGSSVAGPTDTPSAIQAQEITITQPANRAPRAVGTIPAQTLTEDGTALSVDIAPYFRDPDDDLLTYSAISSNPAIVTAGISGTMMALDPASTGTAMITVTASDGNASAQQTVSATVQGRQVSPSTPTTGQQQAERPAPAPAPAPAPQPQPRSPPTREPEIELMDIDIQVRRINRRSASLAISPDPEGAQLNHIILEADPEGRFNYYTKIYDTRHVGFDCPNGFTGDATITISIPDGTIESSVTFACR